MQLQETRPQAAGKLTVCETDSRITAPRKDLWSESSVIGSGTTDGKGRASGL